MLTAASDKNNKGEISMTAVTQLKAGDIKIALQKAGKKGLKVQEIADMFVNKLAGTEHPNKTVGSLLRGLKNQFEAYKDEFTQTWYATGCEDVTPQPTTVQRNTPIFYNLVEIERPQYLEDFSGVKLTVFRDPLTQQNVIRLQVKRHGKKDFEPIPLFPNGTNVYIGPELRAISPFQKIEEHCEYLQAWFLSGGKVLSGETKIQAGEVIITYPAHE